MVRGTRPIAEAYDRGNGAVALLRDGARDTILLVREYRLPAHLNDHPDGMLLKARPACSTTARTPNRRCAVSWRRRSGTASSRWSASSAST